MDYPFKSAGPALEVLSLVMMFVLTLAALAVVVYLAALPGRIAARRKHPQTSAVNVCGWLGLPTGIVWIGAMAWAFWRYPETGDAGLTSLSSNEAKSIASQLDGLENLVTQLEKTQTKGTV